MTVSIHQFLLDQVILISPSFIISFIICLAAMGKRGAAAPKSEAKAKAKTAPRAPSSSSKQQSMTEDELTEYRLLHSKLTYRSKCGIAGADEALQQLKSNRQSVIDKFRGDKSMSWVPSILSVLSWFHDFHHNFEAQ